MSTRQTMIGRPVRGGQTGAMPPTPLAIELRAASVRIANRVSAGTMAGAAAAIAAR